MVFKAMSSLSGHASGLVIEMPLTTFPMCQRTINELWRSVCFLADLTSADLFIEAEAHFILMMAK